MNRSILLIKILVTVTTFKAKLKSSWQSANRGFPDFNFALNEIIQRMHLVMSLLLLLTGYIFRMHSVSRRQNNLQHLRILKFAQLKLL